MNNKTYLYGRNPVIEALKEGKGVEKVFLSFNASGDGISKIYTIAKSKGIQIVKYDRRKFTDLEKKAGIPSRESQGVIAQRELIKFTALEHLLDLNVKTNSNPIIVALDGIEDPHNLGAIARSAECSGARGLIVSTRASAPVTPTAVKASAGALETLRTAKVENLGSALEEAKEEGWWIVGTDLNAQNSYTDAIYDKPIVLVIGSEGKGIRPSVKQKCDYLIQIPMRGKTQSLNASVSAGVVLFEILRQS